MNEQLFGSPANTVWFPPVKPFDVPSWQSQATFAQFKRWTHSLEQDDPASSSSQRRPQNVASAFTNPDLIAGTANEADLVNAAIERSLHSTVLGFDDAKIESQRQPSSSNSQPLSTIGLLQQSFQDVDFPFDPEITSGSRGEVISSVSKFPPAKHPKQYFYTHNVADQS
jgi:hypothetical protein